MKVPAEFEGFCEAVTIVPARRFLQNLPIFSLIETWQYLLLCCEWGYGVGLIVFCVAGLGKADCL